MYLIAYEQYIINIDITHIKGENLNESVKIGGRACNNKGTYR